LATQVTEQELKKLATARGYVTGVAKDVESLERIIQQDSTMYSPDARLALDAHKSVLKVKFAYIGLIALACRYGRGHNSKIDHSNCVKTLVSFIFRYMKVLRNSDATLMAIMVEYAGLVRKNHTPSELAAFLASKAPDDQFCSEFKELIIKDNKLGYYVAAALEEAIAGAKAGVAPRGHSKQQHLEHIMPKTPDRLGWVHIPDLGSEEYDEKCISVGNLIPLSQQINAQIKNKGISDKMKAYKEQSLTSPKMVDKYLDDGRWTYRSIEQRAHDLAENYARLAWPLT
jgi:hypothetical protein